MTKYGVRVTGKFKRDVKLAKKSGRNIDLLKRIVKSLADGQELSPRCRDHQLTGNWRNHRECRIEPDWLLIYRRDAEVLVLTLVRTGSHSELLRK